MTVFRFKGNANTFSVPFDWDNRGNIAYVKKVVEKYFDKGQRVGSSWQPPFFGVVNRLMKLADLGTLAGSERIIFSQKSVDVLRPLIANEVELLLYQTEVGWGGPV